MAVFGGFFASFNFISFVGARPPAPNASIILINYTNGFEFIRQIHFVICIMFGIFIFPSAIPLTPLYLSLVLYYAIFGQFLYTIMLDAWNIPYHRVASASMTHEYKFNAFVWLKTNAIIIHIVRESKCEQWNLRCGRKSMPIYFWLGRFSLFPFFWFKFHSLLFAGGLAGNFRCWLFVAGFFFFVRSTFDGSISVNRNND